MSCAEARGLGPERSIEGVKSGNMARLGEWTATADQVLVF